MITFNAFVEEMKPIHNHICIFYDHEIGRLVGVQDSPADWYYIYITSDGEKRYGTAVGHCVSLKDVYPRYEIMERLFHMNRCKRVDEFLIEVEEI